ncbi:MAG: cell division protein FtsQ/DivIB [Caulobacterales bacterium]|nr:cell division protein FtsQ/DivIB [Caulobacterales bacterium]
MPAVIRGGRRQAAPAPRRRTATASRGPARNASASATVFDQGLTPGMAWMGLGAFALVALAIALFGWGADISRATGRAVDNQIAALGFRLEQVHVQGASAAGQRAILDELRLERGQPFVFMDLDELRTQIEGVGWVGEARVVRLLPNTLVIEVSERRPTAVWQLAGETRVVDANGTVIPGADPGRFSELPLLVGAGANQAAPDLIPLVQRWPRLRDRLDAAVWVDGRRWNLLLRDGSVIQLPAEGLDEAFVQLEAMDQAQRLLDLGFARVDMRVAGNVAIEPRGSA